MNQENNNNDNEILDVKPLLNVIKGFFKGVLIGLVSIVQFYKRYWILFIVLCVIGVIGGYFLEQKFKISKMFYQEIILEPKYGMNNYMYDFIDGLDSKLKDKVFLDKLEIDSSQVSNIKEIELEPIIQVVDVLDGLHLKYGDQKHFNSIIEDYDEKTLEDEKFRNFYVYHRLKLYFKKKSPDNIKISEALLAHIKSNEYYNKLLTLKLNQTKFNLEKNKKTLIYVEEFLDKLNKNQGTIKKDIVVYAEESEIPTISSLLKRKDDLLNVINQQERILTLETELFEVIEYGNIIPYRLGVHKKLIVLLPLIFCFLTSLLFLLRYMSRTINNFIKD